MRLVVGAVLSVGLISRVTVSVQERVTVPCACGQRPARQALHTGRPKKKRPAAPAAAMTAAPWIVSMALPRTRAGHDLPRVVGRRSVARPRYSPPMAGTPLESEHADRIAT